MSILDVIQRACILSGLPSPSGAVTSTDTIVQQMVAFATQEGEETASSYDWRQLKVAGQIIGDGVSTLWTLPSDFERLLPGEAFFSDSYPSIPLIGPLTDEEFLAAKALPVMPIRPIWRLIGNSFEIWPALANGEVVNTQYRSTAWIIAADANTRKTKFTADTDSSLFPERILSMGVIWRWKRAAGLDYAEEFRTYQIEREKIAGHDSGNRTIRMSQRSRIPDTYWPGMISVQT